MAPLSSSQLINPSSKKLLEALGKAAATSGLNFKRDVIIGGVFFPDNYGDGVIKNLQNSSASNLGLGKGIFLIISCLRV